jgi:hypothetical protein
VSRDPDHLAGPNRNAVSVARLGVAWTPTFYINGRKLGQTTTPPQYFDYLIELALKQAK